MQLGKSRLTLISAIGVALFGIIALSHSVYAGGECASLGGGCDNGGWDPMQKLEEIGNPTGSQAQAPARWPEKSRTIRWNQSASGFEDAESRTSETPTNAEASKNMQNATPAKNMEDKAEIMRSDEAKKVLVPLEGVADADILLDVSENSSTHIAGSVVIPYMEFEEQPGVLKNTSDISKILGDAGIDRNDSIVIYGECLPCGGGPSVATYIYWMMKGIGHENVKVLDGTSEDWVASGRTSAKGAKMQSGKIYVPQETTNFTATYDFVRSGQPQIVDARTWQEFGSGSIPGSINIPYEGVLGGKKLKSEDQLDKVFMLLNKDRTVVVFTNTGIKASVVWFALKMMGYDARIYNYRDWVEKSS